MNIGWQEILLILLIALLLFGAKKIPDLAKSLGKGIKEFRKGLKEIENPEEETKTDKAKTEKEP
ncbi:MAG: twin-arginine translocase TatA/TatE family subunit [candidate division WOR-3 bacterium]|nr:MAG: twin-arginine translocase TatA/TatE family subunit [candidate division WOR-3 bacterium]